MQWYKLFIDMADLVAQKSKDRSTKVGAIIIGANMEVLSVGFNGFPRGIDDNNESYHERPTKYAITEHAERNAIYNAARNGIHLDGTSMVLNWYPLPCVDCTRAIIQCGIRKIIGPDRPFEGVSSQWQEQSHLSAAMLIEAKVEHILFGQ